MQWDDVIRISVAMPSQVWRSLYPYLVLSAKTSDMPGLQFRAHLTDMIRGVGLLQPVGISDKSLRVGIKALEALRLITVSQIGTDKPVYAIQTMEGSRIDELVLALGRVAGDRDFVKAVQRVLDEEFWSDIAPTFKGESLSARQLLSDPLQGQMLLIETGERPVRGTGGPVPGTGGPVTGTGGPVSPTGETPIFSHAPRSGSYARGRLINAEGVDQQERTVAVQRRTKEEVERHREETRKRKAKGIADIKAGRMPSNVSKGGVGQKNTRGTSKVQPGLQKTEKREKKKSVTPYRPGCDSGWDKVHEQLKLMFGDDCLEVWEDGTVRPNESNPNGIAAFQILGFRVDGFRNRNWRDSYYQPSAECVVNVLKAYRLWTTRFYNQPCNEEAVVFVRQLLYRTRGAGKTRIPHHRVLMAVAGLAYWIVQAKIAEKPQFLPNNTKWLSIFNGSTWRNLHDRYAKGIAMGEVPRDPEEWLESFPEADLMPATKDEVKHLVKTVASPVFGDRQSTLGDLASLEEFDF